MTEHLVDLLAALHAERINTWPPQQLQRNIDQRRINVERFDPRTAPKVGAVRAVRARECRREQAPLGGSGQARPRSAGLLPS